MLNRARIAQVSPLYESVPPQLYGGTERVVHNLAETLSSFGHDVTVFASGDSRVSGRLIAGWPRALRLSESSEKIAPHLLMFERVRALAAEFDIIHFHTEYLHFGLARSLDVPTVSTLHGRLDIPEYKALFGEFAELPLVSISKSQRSALPAQNWAGVVPHGLPKDAIQFHEKPSDYLAFLGRISPEKGIEQAITIAERTGLKLKVAAKIDPADRDYADPVVSRMRAAGIEFIGEIGDRQKGEFLGGAMALLFPIQWPEPFGLVMIEALAAGTPVVAFRAGSVPEVIRHGRTGFIVDRIEEACGAVRAIVDNGVISRRDCRRHFESKFVAERMALDYLQIYERLIEARQSERSLASLAIGRDRSRLSQGRLV